LGHLRWIRFLPILNIFLVLFTKIYLFVMIETNEIVITLIIISARNE
jgi:hypothetical protein